MTKIIGHRGAASEALENTFASFKLALQTKVYMIETDVQVTKDNHFIIFHDNLLDRISDGKGYVSDLTLQEIKKVTLIDGSKIIELKELCEFLKETSTDLFIEVKNEDVALRLYKFVSLYLPNSRFIVGSFIHYQIYDLKKLIPKAQTCIIFESYPIDLKEYIYKANPDYVSVGFESITDQMILEIKETGKRILFWTIDNSTDFYKALSYKPFGIISNKPALMLNLLKEKNADT